MADHDAPQRITWAGAWSIPLPAAPPDPVVFGEPGPASEYAAAGDA